MRTVLITGATRFIASHLSELFLKKNCAVIGVDNFSNNYSKKVHNNNLNILRKYDNFIFYKSDILSQKKTYSIIGKHRPDFLIHCAAKVGIRKSINNPLMYNKINVLGTQTVLEAIRKYSPKTKIILVSSSSIFGEQKKLPFSENFSPRPLSPYGLSKYLMEVLANYYFRTYKIPIVIVRAFSIYGPRGRTDMLPFLIINSYLRNRTLNLYGTNKNNKRDWTYIDDFVGVLNNVIDGYKFGNFEIFNIGRGHSVGIDDFTNYFILQLNKFMKKNIKIKRFEKQAFETSITLANIEKAKIKLRYNPKTSYKEGIIKTINYFLENKSLYFND